MLLRIFPAKRPKKRSSRRGLWVCNAALLAALRILLRRKPLSIQAFKLFVTL
jgi:hypothetical protein